MFNIKKRIVEEANFIIENNATIRETAKEFSLGKSTIHKDVSEKLEEINPQLFTEVKKIMHNHLETRHIKGGEVTKRKYEKLRK